MLFRRSFVPSKHHCVTLLTIRFSISDQRRLQFTEERSLLEVQTVLRAVVSAPDSNRRFCLIEMKSAKQVVAMRLRERMDHQCRKHMARSTRVFPLRPSSLITTAYRNDDVTCRHCLLPSNAQNFRGVGATKKLSYPNMKHFIKSPRQDSAYKVSHELASQHS